MRVEPVARMASLLAVVALSSAAMAGSAGADPISESKGFRKAVTVAGIREHQLALQQIADAHNGNRAVASPGDDASVEYVAGKAEAAGYDVRLEEFSFVSSFSEDSAPVLQETAPEPQTFVAGTRPAFDGDFVTFTGAGDVTAPVQGVDLVLPPRRSRMARLADARSRISAASFPGTSP